MVRHPNRSSQYGPNRNPVFKVCADPAAEKRQNEKNSACRTSGGHGEPIRKTVVNISSHSVTEPDLSLVTKGSTFCPTTTTLNELQLTADLLAFYRRLRLKDFFAERPNAHVDFDKASAFQNTNLRRKSLLQPPKVTVAAEVETFVGVFHQSVRTALQGKRGKETTHNLTKEEHHALCSLQKRSDIVIRPADKGSAVVLQDSSTYRADALQQL